MPRLLIALALLALLGVASAQVRTSWSGQIEAEFGAEFGGSITDTGVAANLTLDGEIGAAFFPSATFRSELRAEANALTGNSSIRLGETWARLFLGDTELTVGNQRVFWGSADGVNPVDRLNPRDLTVPPEAEKLPVPMLHLRAYLEEDVNFEVALVPVFTPSLPPGEDWRQVSPFTPPPGTTVTEIRPLREVRPVVALENIQFGVRAQWRPRGFDLALTYLHLFRDLPTLSVEIEATGVPGEVTVQPIARYDRVDLIGIDGSVALGGVVLRAEAAYLITADPHGRDPAVGNPSFQVVAGAEMPIPDGPRVIIQGVLDGEKRDASPDGSAGNFELDLRTMALARYTVNTRTDVEAAWIHDFDGSGVIRPGVAYTIADGVTGTVEASIAYGADGTRFGAWRERSRAVVGLRIGF